MNRKQKRAIGIRNNFFSKRNISVEQRMQIRMMEQVAEMLEREEKEKREKDSNQIDELP